MIRIYKSYSGGMQTSREGGKGPTSTCSDHSFKGQAGEKPLLSGKRGRSLRKREERSNHRKALRSRIREVLVDEGKRGQPDSEGEKGARHRRKNETSASASPNNRGHQGTRAKEGGLARKERTESLPIPCGSPRRLRKKSGRASLSIPI